LISNLYEYLVTDIYYLLWMCTNKGTMSPATAGLSVWRGEYNEDFLSLFSDPRDIPDVVTIAYAEHEMKGEEGFHSVRGKASVKIKSMKLQWGETDLEMPRSAPALFRENGPARIILEGLQKWHKNGDLSRPYRKGKSPAVKCDLVKFQWCTKDPQKLYRSCGPMELVLYGVKIYHDNDTDIPLHRKFSFERMSFRWNTHGGTVIPERNVYKALDAIACEEKDKYNLMTTGDSIFLDSLDEFLFWQEVDVD